MERQEVRAFAPATAGNLGFGPRVVGLAFNGLGDEVTAASRRGTSVEVTVNPSSRPEGAGQGDIEDPTLYARIVRRAAEVTLGQAGMELGLLLTVTKGVPCRAGLGGREATAAATAFTVNRIIGSPLRKQQLVHACLADAELGRHLEPDHLAPAMLGGLILVRGGALGELIRLPLPPELMMVVVVPRLSPGQDGVTLGGVTLGGRNNPLRGGDSDVCQANLAAFTTACFTGDLGLLARSLDGVCVGRDGSGRLADSPLGIAVDAGLDAGALGSGSVGGGPALFALCRSRRSAQEVGQVMCRALEGQSIEADAVTADVDCPGARGLGDSSSDGGPSAAVAR